MNGLSEAAQKALEASCAESGVPLQVDDHSTLEKLSALLRAGA
jgi:hypothetical protein